MDQAERLCDELLLLNHGTQVLGGRTADMLMLRSNRIQVELDLSVPVSEMSVESLRQHGEVSQDGATITIVLSPGVQAQHVIAEVVQALRVQSVEVCRPTLHQTYLRLVGQDHA